MNIKRDILWRIYLVFAFICLSGIAVIFQSFRIQVLEGAYWRGLADSLQTEMVAIEAERGNILSEDGRLLATSLPFFEIRMDVASPALNKKMFYEQVDSLSFCLSQHFQDKTEAAYRKMLVRARKSGERYLLIQRKVTYTDLIKVKQFPMFRQGKYKGGVIVIQQNKRTYPFRLLANRTIGYVREGIQPVGLEGVFNHELSGTQGKRLMQKIAGGIWIPINDENEIEPQNGRDLITTIDINLQDVAEHALLNALTKHRAEHGCAILMEVKTGKIKAIANLGRDANGEYWETYNYAIGESTEPGSTFKLASIIALMEDGLIDTRDTVDIEKGSKQYFDLTLKDSEQHDETRVTIQRAFEISSNVGISKLVFDNYQAAPKRYVQHLFDLGLNEKTHIEIEGEPDPLIKKPGDKKWSRVSLPFMSVGYELKLTPLQILLLYNAIGNEGKMMQPHLVSEIQEFGKTVKIFEPRVINKKICSAQTLSKARELLEGVVEAGTAKNIKSPNYKIAGKTGTAKIADREHGYQEVYQASFAGYFPADRPRYSCIVVINSPSGGTYYGSQVAAPVFREIADKVVATQIEMYEPVNRHNTYKADKTAPVAKAGSRQDMEKIYNSLGISFASHTEGEWVICFPKDNSVELKEVKLWKGHVPDVTGMGLKDAMQLLEENGLRVKVIGKGKVRSQSLPVGEAILWKGQQIVIELS